MTADEHAAAIADSLWEVERAAKRLRKAIKVHHDILNAAQEAFDAEYPGTIQARSGGTDKPPPPPPGDDDNQK